MAKYKKRALPVDAVNFTGFNNFEVLRFMGIGERIVNNLELKPTDCPYIDTPYGKVVAEPGDWVIRTPEGELHHVDKEHFDKFYEPA